jgi:transposase
MERGRPKLKLAMEPEVVEILRGLRRKPRNIKQKEKVQALLLAHSGKKSYEEIAEIVSRARSTIQVWVKAFEEKGVSWLEEKPIHPGRPSEMSNAKIQKAMLKGLKAGRWVTGVEIQRWLKKEHGLSRSMTSIYYWLGKLAGALKVPRPVHIKKDVAEAEAFKEHLYEKLLALELPKTRRVRVWVQDEARYGLHSVRRRCWGIRGLRVVKPAQQKYEWGYVYGALDVLGGGGEFCYMPTVNLELTQTFLYQLAQSDEEAEHIVVWDQAGFHHRANDKRLPDRIHVVPLPAYSPELNPIEKLWDQMKDRIVNRVFETLDEIEGVLSEALRPFWESPTPARRLVGTGWLHSSANAS